MNVKTNVTPPAGTRRIRHKYASLVQALGINDGWVSVESNEITGATKGQKQTAIHSVCNRAKIRIETRTDGNQVFIRRLTPAEVDHAN